MKRYGFFFICFFALLGWFWHTYQIIIAAFNSGWFVAYYDFFGEMWLEVIGFISIFVGLIVAVILELKRDDVN